MILGLATYLRGYNPWPTINAMSTHTSQHTAQAAPDAYQHFSRKQWELLRQDTALTLSDADIEALSGYTEVISPQEVEAIYLPLSRLLNLYVKATQSLHQASEQFLNSKTGKAPYLIGIAGSVAVGKSTSSRLLQALLSRWPDHPRVEILQTDGFLYPTAELERRDILNRKGFPESYDLPALIQCLHDLKAGKAQVRAPVYSHHHYDIVSDEFVEINQPDIVIVEGLNILQTGVAKPGKQPELFVSDFFDFSIFVDAPTTAIREWFIQRVQAFCQGPFQEPDSYFHHLTKLNHEQLVEFASRVWREINERNLLENILPFRDRAQLILTKAADHSVQQIALKKL